MPSYCPHCDHEIDRLNYNAHYSEYGMEYGSCNLNGDDCESDERNGDDGDTQDYEYQCPECDHELSPDDIINSDDDDSDSESDDDEDNEDDEDNVTDGGDNVINPLRIPEQKPMKRSYICPECHHVNFRDPNEASFCEECSHELE
jgi:hypothetical protein